MTAFNGSGVLVRTYDWTDDRDASVKINASRMDTEMDGTVAAINAILSSSQPFKAPAPFASGTAAAPGITFEGDTDSGIYRIGADNLGVTLGGTQRLNLTTTSLTSTVINLLPAGAVGAPAYSFSGDTDTGIYLATTDTLAIATNGTARLTLNTASATLTLPALLPDGSVGAPALSFSGDTDSGIYRIGTNSVGIAVGGAAALTIDANKNTKLEGELQAVAYLGTQVALSGTTPTVDCDAGNFFTLTTTGNTTFTFDYSGVNLTTNDVYGFALQLTSGGAHSITYPGTVVYDNGTQPDDPASGETDLLYFMTFNGGTSWFCVWLMDDAS